MRIVPNKLLCLLIITNCYASSLDIHHDYFFDNQSFESHQLQTTLKTDIINLYNVVNVLKDDNIGNYTYQYYHFTKSFNINNHSLELGPGIIYSDNFTVPSYYLNYDYNFSSQDYINLESFRLPILSSENIGSDINIINNLVQLTNDYLSITYKLTTTDKSNVKLGYISQIISDGNKKIGGILRYTYNINDNLNFQYKHKTVLSKFESNDYFSPDLYMRNWFLIGYNFIIPDYDIDVTLVAGPGITTVNNDSVISKLLELTVTKNLSIEDSINIHLNCNDSVYSYHFCIIGSQLTIAF